MHDKLYNKLWWKQDLQNSLYVCMNVFKILIA